MTKPQLNQLGDALLDWFKREVRVWLPDLPDDHLAELGADLFAEHPSRMLTAQTFLRVACGRVLCRHLTPDGVLHAQFLRHDDGQPGSRFVGRVVAEEEMQPLASFC